MKLLCGINLYADRLTEERAKRPRRLAITGAIIAAAAVALGWAGLEWRVSLLKTEQTNARSIEAGLDRNLAAAREKAQVRAAKVARRNIVVDRTAGRLCAAPLLQHIFASAPANVEFSSMGMKFDEYGGCTISVTGRAAGSQPRIETDKCRLQLVTNLNDAGYEATAAIQQLEDIEATIHLGDSEVAAAEFVLVLKIRPVKHEPRKA